MKTASPRLLEVMLVRVNAGGNASRDPPPSVVGDGMGSLVTGDVMGLRFRKVLVNERGNIFAGGPLRSGHCLVRILRSSTCKHVSSGQTGDRRALRAARS